MHVSILFRNTIREEDEFEVAKKYFPVRTSRCDCVDSLVIGRYSCLPFYKELVKDLSYHNSSLINSYDQHLWISNFEYYNVLQDYTFESWDSRSFPYSNYDGPLVVKGKTNSKKHHWNSMMFANNRREAAEVATRLQQDNLIAGQELIYRKYVPLVTYEVGINDLAFTNEHRCFFLGEKLIAHSYYWTEADDVSHTLSDEGMEFALKIAKIASKYTNFFVLDIGEKAEGGWILVEVNDGQMCGLSMIDPDVLYFNLSEALDTWRPK
jgi:ATP-grasp domain, R2K clade family 3